MSGKVHLSGTIGAPDRETKVRAFLDQTPCNNTPIDELMYGGKTLKPSQEPPPVPDSPALTQILAHLGDIKTFMEHKAAKAPGVYAPDPSAQAALDSELDEV